jgi:myosin heavy subunit
MMKSTTAPESKASTRKSVRSKSKEKAPGNAPTSQRPPDPRVGTRSVNTLSDAQLERKRANDREAQRIIRQRTREHIENLERQVAELGEQKEQLNKALQHNAELEAQIAQLQQQLADMALLLQYRHSPGMPGYTDTTTVYTARSCVPLSSLTVAPQMLTECRCTDRARYLSCASIARLCSDEQHGITPAVYSLRLAGAHT